MIRAIFKEVYTGHVVHAGGQIETHMKTFLINLPEIEAYLKYTDQINHERPEYLTRELVGFEIIGEKKDE